MTIKTIGGVIHVSKVMDKDTKTAKELSRYDMAVIIERMAEDIKQLLKGDIKNG